MNADTGALLGSLDYSPYGQVQRQSGGVSPVIQYGQLPWDGNVGLSVSPTRLYDASVGRWLSRDPIGEAGGINLYAYVGGSPIGFTDPSGLDSEIPFPNIGGLLWEAGATAVGGLGTWWNNDIAPYIFPTNPNPAPNSTPSPTASPTTGTSGSQNPCQPQQNPMPKNFKPPTHPPQHPKIPQGWVSRPGSGGQTIWEPPGSTGKGPGIRIDTNPRPGYPNGKWIETNANGQPIIPGTGRTGSPEATHIPLPPP